MSLPKNIYTIGQLNNYIANMFSQDYLLTSLYVQGEVSNLKYHSSGHIYFTLKDDKAAIACIMFSGNRSGLNFEMKEGMQVIAGGSVQVYARDGKYQLYAQKILLAGTGQLSERFEQLKKELSERGMFAPEYKQEIPRFIKTLGVVTAPTGAAVQDIINITRRRNPYVQILLYPAIVQGENAAASIVRGIQTLEKSDADVIIVGRGGGSIEDLWAFNEEVVAQAVFDCSKPIISAVGHETDTTICDYVADLRAPTPSAAAELAVYKIDDYMQNLMGIQAQFMQLMRHQIHIADTRTKQYGMRLNSLNPERVLRERKVYLLQLEDRLQNAMQRKDEAVKNRLALLAERMKAVSPLEKLGKGYGYISDLKGKSISDVDNVNEGDQVQITLKNGILDARVTSVKNYRRLQNEE